MWQKGISAYIGLEHSLETVCDYLALARRYGYTRLFTSLNLPEAGTTQLLQDFRGFLGVAAGLGYEITADISPKALGVLGESLSEGAVLSKRGLTALRLDYGFSPEQIAAITRCGDIKVEINASTVTPAILEGLRQAKANFANLSACHNYYPRPETGLAFSIFAERCRLLRSYGIPIFAFLPSCRSPRGPLFAGLPTLEKHRSISPETAAKEFLACRLVDGLLFGDPLVSENELASVAALDDDCIELQVVVEPDISPTERDILFSAPHTNRLDPGENAIRSQQARLRVTDPIPARAAKARRPGAVTVDNHKYLRYMGEMQLVLSPLPADSRVNLAAQVIPEEVFLLSYIQPGGAFRLKEAPNPNLANEV